MSSLAFVRKHLVMSLAQGEERTADETLPVALVSEAVMYIDPPGMLAEHLTIRMSAQLLRPSFSPRRGMVKILICPRWLSHCDRRGCAIARCDRFMISIHTPFVGLMSFTVSILHRGIPAARERT